MTGPTPKPDLYSRATLWARRLGRHYVVVLLLASVVTVAAVVTTTRLRFNSDLADLLPEDHPELRALRRIQAKYSTDTGFMVLLSRNYVFAADSAGVVHMHNGRRWIRTRTGGPLNALWGFAPDNVFAAGTSGRVLRFDGRRWRRTGPTPGKANLRSLWGDSPTRLFAVGSGGTITRFDGSKWRHVDSPTSVDLHGVSGAGSDLFVVGDQGTILRQDGAAFVVEPSPTRHTLHAVFALGHGDAAAVGGAGTFLVRQHGRWRAVPTGARQSLRSVWGTRLQNVQAVGDDGLALRFDGERIARQGSTTADDLYAIHGVQHDDVWAVGSGCTVKRFDWEWFPGPYDTRIGEKPVPCSSQLTAVWRPRADLASAKALAPRLAAALERSPNVQRVDFKKPVQFFQDRALLFSSVEDLQRLRDRIEEDLERETARGTGLYVDLEPDRGKQSGRDLGQLFKKYQQMASAFGQSEWFEHPDGTSLGLVVYPRKGVSNFASLKQLWTEIDGIIDRTMPRGPERKTDPLLRVDVGGDAVAKIREYDATVTDVFGKAWIAVLGIILLMLVYFRRIVGLFFVALPLGMSIAWTFAVTTVFIGTLNAVTGFLFAVLFGLGIDYGLQLYARYREGRSAGLSVDDAMNHVVLDTGRATLTSALTTSAALLTLTVTDFKGFSEFGFIAGIGVLLALISFILVMPAMILLAERFKLLRIKVTRTTARGDREAPGQEPFRLPRLVLLISAAVLIYGIFGATRVRFEYDNRKLRAPRPKDEIVRRARRTLGRSFTPTLLLANSRDELEAAVDAIERGIKLRGRRSAVKNVLTILDLVPRRQREKKAILDEIDELLRDKRWNLVGDRTRRRIHLKQLRRLVKAEPFTLRDLPRAARRSFKGPGFGSIWLAMVFHAVDLGHTKQARILKDQVGRFAGTPWVNLGNLLPAGARAVTDLDRAEIVCSEPRPACVDVVTQRLRRLRDGGRSVFAHVVTRQEAYRHKLAVAGGLRGDLLAICAPGYILRPAKGSTAVQPSGMFHVSSGELVLAEVVEVLLRDGRIAFVLALVAIFVAAMLDFRSARAAGLACLPLVVGLLWTFGVMSLIQLKLNLFNFVILPALLGIGIDYGVHYVHRYHSEGPGHLGRVMRALYWVIFFCAATTIVGFGNMALASHPGLKSLGQLAIIGLACIFFASTYTLPALIYLLERVFGLPRRAQEGEVAVTVFATSYCPSCRLVQRLLAEQGVTFACVELDALPTEERERLAGEIVLATGTDTLPVTRVGERHVVGFDREQLMEAVGNPVASSRGAAASSRSAPQGREDRRPPQGREGAPLPYPGAPRQGREDRRADSTSGVTSRPKRG